MSLLPCSACGQRKPGKFAVAYWAWFDSLGDRQAWKARYCLDDAAEELRLCSGGFSPLADPQSVFACSSCGIDTTGDQEPVYCTLYLPRQEAMEVSIPLCGACAVKLRTRIMSISTRLENRDIAQRKDSSLDAWAALGILPRPDAA